MIASPPDSPAGRWHEARKLLPGLALAAAVAVASGLLAPRIAPLFPIPAMVLALLIGIVLNGFAERRAFHAGLLFAIKVVLRWAVGLLGLRVALGDIMALGLGTAIVVIAGMIVTLLSGFAFARLLGERDTFGALAGAGTAVCGASATLATSSVLPAYQGKEADVVFVVIAVNLLSTAAMVLYPPLCAWLGFSDEATGAMLGATIHDVAQVVGAGYAVSEPVGNVAVIVKLFRVFLLLPVVLALGWYFARRGTEAAASVPVPVFAVVFLALCIVNSVMPELPALMPVYAPVRTALLWLSAAGLLLAISALGLTTSLRTILMLGWRHAATVTGTTLVILVVMTAGLALTL